jgi:dTDP-4-dehydrorhamnose reductase
MKILVTGANGMLGASIKEVFRDHELILTDSIDLDIRNIKRVMTYADKDLELILHLAAETDHFKAEFDPSDCYFTNHTGTVNMIELARSQNIPIVYISTGGIFDGAKESYTEEDQPYPLNHYGRSKYYGELAMKSYDKHYIIRNGWSMGGGGLDKKFINKVYRQILAGKKTLYGITDVFGNPTYTLDFAKTVYNIIDDKAPYGIYNAGGKGSASRFEVLETFVDYLGMSKELTIIPVTDAEFREIFPGQCPYTKSEVLSIDKIEKMGLSAMRDWRVALKDYIKTF